MATAYGATDAPPSTAVARSRRRPYIATASGTIVDHCNRSKLKKLPLNLGAWNVCTTNDSVLSVRPERATAIICLELEKANIDICAFSELRCLFFFFFFLVLFSVY